MTDLWANIREIFAFKFMKQFFYVVNLAYILTLWYGYIIDCFLHESICAFTFYSNHPHNIIYIYINKKMGKVK